jgi:serine/threonine-protein kinase
MSTATPPPSSGVGAPARRVGPFSLDALIGRGAAGEVHLATETASGARVALKLVRLDEAAPDADLHRRFVAEAAAAQRLVHPDIVRVFGAGVADGLGWIAMEPLAGCDLVRYTRAARLLPEPVVLHVGARVARALAHAHALGVVHRDVKPANVMVDWTADRVVLTDFGIARLADAQRTRTGLVLGTPAYMAPEQLGGATADATGDVYALGVMLFELLTGRRPHEAASLGELLRQVAQQPAPDLRQLRPELPPALAALVAAALAKRPGERPAGAAALADALETIAATLESGVPVPPNGPKSRP